MSLFASLFPIICWLAYTLGVTVVEARWPSLSVIMSLQRRSWVTNTAGRVAPMDAILSGNLMRSDGRLASISMLIVLAIFAAFGQVSALMTALADLGLGATHTLAAMQIHLLVILTIFGTSFFAFSLSLRQFNHFCIMLGAMSHSPPASDQEIDAIAMLNSLAAKNFNTGIRAYYFAVPAAAWFASDWFSIGVTIVTTGVIIHREFFSSAHRIAASVAVIASRRERAAHHPVEPTVTP